MRQLAETERLLVEKIVQLKQAARLEELQVARLLRKELECFALRWVLEPKKTLLFYSIQNKTDWNVLLKSKRYHLRLKLMKKEFYMIEGNIGIILRTIHFGE